jgi:hypothetical protein
MGKDNPRTVTPEGAKALLAIMVAYLVLLTIYAMFGLSRSNQNLFDRDGIGMQWVRLSPLCAGLLLEVLNLKLVRERRSAILAIGPVLFFFHLASTPSMLKIIGLISSEHFLAKALDVTLLFAVSAAPIVLQLVLAWRQSRSSPAA